MAKPDLRVEPVWSFDTAERLRTRLLHLYVELSEIDHALLRTREERDAILREIAEIDKKLSRYDNFYHGVIGSVTATG